MPCEHALDALHRTPQVCELGGRKLGEPAVRTQWADQDVPWEEGFEVDEGEGVKGGEENLWWFSGRIG
jgi:hypothetical protein